MNASPDNAAPLSSSAAPADTDLSRLVAATFAAITGEPVDLDQTFWEVGGTSLSFIDLAARLEKELGTEVRAEDIMEYDTPGLLAAHLLAEITTRRQTPAPAASAQA
jgi:acyl carrier protein